MKIYLAGSMTGMSWEEQNEWRVQIKSELLKKKDFGGYNVDLTIVNPCEFFNYYQAKNTWYSEKEAMDFDIYQIRHSDLIIVRFNNPNSIGTAMELMLAKELNIPVLGWLDYDWSEERDQYADFSKKIESIHPWLQECCTRIFPCKEDVVKYVENFYLKSCAKES